MQLVTFLLPETYLEGIERLVELGCFESRSEAVRLAVKEIIRRELWISRKTAGNSARTHSKGSKIRLISQC